jgi:Dolichyl-phosphate-mannose-protein mannosyltransferase
LREKLKIVLASTGMIVVVAFVVRMAILFYLSYVSSIAGTGMAEGSPFGSETGAIAASIAAGRGFSSPLRFVQTGPTAWLAPIYPYILAGIFKLFGTYSSASNLVSHTLDCVFSAFTAWPIAAIGTIAFGKKTGRAAAWLWTVLPTSVFYSIFWIWDTALAGLWMGLLVLATLKLRGSSRLAAWIGYGALWAIGALINPSLLSVLPFLALWAIWPQAPARAAKLAAASALIFLLCLTPWTIRNYVVFHKLIPLRSNFGLELLLGMRADLPDGIRSPLHPNDNLEEAQKYARMGEIAYMQDKQRQALAMIRESPTGAVILFMRRLEENWLDLWDSPYDLWVAATVSDKLAMLGNALFAALCWLGALIALRERKDAALPLAFVLLAFPMVFYLTHASLRYRQPMDGIMLLLAVYATGHLYSHFAARFWASPQPLPAAQSALDQ